MLKKYRMWSHFYLDINVTRISIHQRKGQTRFVLQFVQLEKRQAQPRSIISNIIRYVRLYKSYVPNSITLPPNRYTKVNEILHSSTQRPQILKLK